MFQSSLAKIQKAVRHAAKRMRKPEPTAKRRVRRQPRTLAELELLSDPLPYAVSVEVTGSCNLKCTMCPLTEGTTSSGAAGRSMSPDLWTGLLDELSPSVSTLAFTGFGEPMLNRDFGTMLLQADQRGVATCFNTNGATLPAGFTALAGQLHRLTQINVSIDTVNDAAYRRIRGGKVKKALASLESLNAAFGERFLVSASAIVMKSTVADLPALVESIGAIKVRNLVLQNLHDQSPTGLSEGVGGALERKEALETALTLASTHGVQIYFEDWALLQASLDEAVGSAKTISGPDEARVCNIAWDMPHIDSLGGVYPCCRASAVSSEKLGDLNDNTFEDIWNGAAFRDFRSRMLNRQGPCPSICAGCDTAAIGTPTIGEYAALLLLDESDLRGPLVRLKVRNVGRETWTGSMIPVVGTSRRRDRTSAAQTASWYNAQRAARPVEATIAPGEVAHYNFELGYLEPNAEPEWFQLVIDGFMWMTATTFAAGAGRLPLPWPAIEEAVIAGE